MLRGNVARILLEARGLRHLGIWERRIWELEVREGGMLWVRYLTGEGLAM